MSVPQLWFGHFYALGSCVNALVLMYIGRQLSITAHAPEEGDGLPLESTSGGRALLASVFEVLLMLQLHLGRRFLETYFVMVYPEGAKMHVIAYTFGLSYYAGENRMEGYLVHPGFRVDRAWFCFRILWAIDETDPSFKTPLPVATLPAVCSCSSLSDAGSIRHRHGPTYIQSCDRVGKSDRK